MTILHHTPQSQPSSASTPPLSRPTSGDPVASTAEKSFPQDQIPKNDLFIENQDTDKFRYGILPTSSLLTLPPLKLSSRSEILACMDTFDPTGAASQKLQAYNNLLHDKWDAHCMYGFPDIISLAAPMMRQRGSTIVRLPPPMEFCASLLCTKQGFVVFYHRLKELLGRRALEEIQRMRFIEEPSAELKRDLLDWNITRADEIEGVDMDAILFKQAFWVMEQYERLRKFYPQWEDEASNTVLINFRDLDFLEDVHNCFDGTTDYFTNLQRTHNLQYGDLMAAHMSRAVFYWHDCTARIRDGKQSETYGSTSDGRGSWEAEGMHMYFKYLPAIVKDVKARGFEGSEGMIEEAWLVMMFRGMCWWRCHSVWPGEDQRQRCKVLPSK